MSRLSTKQSRARSRRQQAINKAAKSSFRSRHEQYVAECSRSGCTPMSVLAALNRAVDASQYDWRAFVRGEQHRYESGQIYVRSLNTGPGGELVVAVLYGNCGPANFSTWTKYWIVDGRGNPIDEIGTDTDFFQWLDGEVDR